MLHTLAFNLDWNIEIRAILVVGLAVVILPGSIYMILSTNLGTRLGFLVALAGVFGWMTIMGTIWTVYGIGYVGTAPSWKVQSVVDSAPEDSCSANCIVTRTSGSPSPSKSNSGSARRS